MSSFPLCLFFLFPLDYTLFFSDAQRETIPTFWQTTRRKKKKKNKAKGGMRKCRQRLCGGALLFRCSCTSCSRCVQLFASSADCSEPHSATITTSPRPTFACFFFFSFQFFSVSFLLFKSSLPALIICDEMAGLPEAGMHNTVHSLVEFTGNYKAQKR